MYNSQLLYRFIKIQQNFSFFNTVTLKVFTFHFHPLFSWCFRVWYLCVLYLVASSTSFLMLQRQTIFKALSKFFYSFTIICRYNLKYLHHIFIKVKFFWCNIKQHIFLNCSRCPTQPPLDNYASKRFWLIWNSASKCIN